MVIVSEGIINITTISGNEYTIKREFYDSLEEYKDTVLLIKKRIRHNV